MQFKRLKILMIILFISLDSFLFVWWRSNRPDSTQVTDANTTIISEIKHQNIQLSKFSTKIPYANYLAGKQSSKLISLSSKMSNYEAKVKNQQLSVVFKVPQNINTNGSKSETSKYIGNQIDPVALAYSAGYQYNKNLSYEQGTKQAIYSQEIDKRPVISQQGLFVVNYQKDGKATGFTQTKISHITELRDERVTLSEEDAIVSLYRFNELNSGDKLSKGTLSYDSTLKVNGYDIYTPVWLFVVTHSDGERDALKINAFTGDNLSE
ncbi:two-component system regulatory protein YycI [Leuconostoc pseudomesenteroides]|uniref:two-component system regulatory protein YycI n=2 Tax=Bacillati TaxID=1783272 RepID=UPI002286CA09|nr:two-component system regulatory protein YycI [Leuconostoc pseudomesenteroides]WAM38694.1 two-component system regulatory protein YycI [Leuconostoc pseudomesenteroides]